MASAGKTVSNLSRDKNAVSRHGGCIGMTLEVVDWLPFLWYMNLDSNHRDVKSEQSHKVALVKKNCIW